MRAIFGILQAIFFFCVLVFILLLFSCKSTRAAGIDDTAIVIANQRAIERLENTAAELGKLHTRAAIRVANIRNEAARIGDSVDRLEYLFTEYDRQVGELLAEINAIRAKAGSEK